MKKNMNILDRITRIFIAALVGVLFFTNQISGIAAIILGIFAAIFLFTSFIGFCPLYSPFKTAAIKKN